MPATKEEWLTATSELYELGKRLYQEADLIDSELGAADPKVIAITLLCRTMSHAEGVVAMVERGLVVEARILLRCCYENLIWIDGLAKDGSKFVQKIAGDELASRKRRGKNIRDWAEKQTVKPSFGQKLHSYVLNLESSHPKVRHINFKEISAEGALKDSYIIYLQLSSDAAHPSASSLSRYIHRDEENLHIRATPEFSQEE